MAKPFAAFTSVPSANFHLPEPPKLHPHVTEKGLVEGVKAFDEAMVQWKSAAEKALADHFGSILDKIQAGNTG